MDIESQISSNTLTGKPFRAVELVKMIHQNE
jgi:hypothetical protein